MNAEQEFSLTTLIIKSLEGNCSPQEQAELNRLVNSSPKARQVYLDCIHINAELSHRQGLQTHGVAAQAAGDVENGLDTSLLDSAIWEALAEDEKTAETVQPVRPEPARPLPIRMLEVPKPVRRVNKPALITAFAAMAALLLAVVYVTQNPKIPSVPVARVIDSLDAQGDNPAVSFAQGARLFTNTGPIRLKQGFVKIVFDDGAQVVLEGPAEYELTGYDHLNLSYGRLYAMVPPQAIGFSVNTPTSKIVDLGTEFGVASDLTGDLELHVLEGKTVLFAKDKSGSTSRQVSAGSAKKVSPWQTISDIPCNRRLFARNIDSREKLVWRGQKSLDMTDMITGGDGENKNRGLGKLGLLTGRRVGDLFVGQAENKPGFRPAPDMPFIDGVFIPDQGDGQIVSATGLRFEQCPDTAGTAFYNISTIREIPSLGAAETYALALFENNASLPGTMLLHPNAGITFDLSAIRSHYSGWQITSFTTTYGFPAAVYKNRAKASADALINSPGVGTVDFYILIDGVIRQMIPFRMGMKPETIQIPISDQDRFLSLVAADSNQSNHYDWFVLENPKLLLEE